MDEEGARLIKIFYSYAHKDEELRNELDNHLGKDHVTSWHDRKITAGTEWLIEINKNLDSADIILLLISAYYLSSAPCIEEMNRAKARLSRGEAKVIPVILRPVAEERLTPLRDFQFLPTDGKPVESDYWPHRHNAFANIASGIHQKIEEILSDVNFFVKKGDNYSKQGSYKEAIVAYEKAIGIIPEDASIHEKKGHMLFILQRYPESIEAYLQATSLDKGNAQLWRDLAVALATSRRFTEARAAYEEATRCIDAHDSKNSYLYKEFGDVLFEIEEIQQAINAYDIAIQLNGNVDLTYLARSKAYARLSQNDLEKAKQLGRLKKMNEK